MTKVRGQPKEHHLYMANTFISILKAIEFFFIIKAAYEIIACYDFIGTLFFVLWVWTEF